jgi:hypothetical protein
MTYATLLRGTQHYPEILALAKKISAGKNTLAYFCQTVGDEGDEILRALTPECAKRG